MPKKRNVNMFTYDYCLYYKLEQLNLEDKMPLLEV